MRNTIIILFFPFLAASQTVIDKDCNIIGYTRLADSTKYFASKFRADSLRTALMLDYALKASPTFTGTVSGITASMVGLGNCTNESKATMFTSPTFTGTPVYPAGLIPNAALANGAVANLSGTNSGDNSVNTTYANDFRAANFVAGTNYLAPNGSAAALTSFPTLNQNTTGTAGGLSANIAESQVTNLVSDLALKSPLASPAFTGTPTGIGLPVYARVTGSNATTTGQALVNITGLSVALVINATYEFEAVLSGSVTAVTTGNQYGINYSVAGSTIEAQITGAFTSTASKTERITALNTATSAFLTTSAQTGGIVIKGVIATGANAGNLTISHLKNTSGTSTVFINSFIKVTRIL